MVQIPTVKTFRGCIDLKVACITIAAFRMVISIILVIALFVIYFVFHEYLNEANESKVDGETAKIYTIIFTIYLIIVVPIIFINILCSYWFIKGATSDNPTKMKYYIIIEAINIVLFLFRFNTNSIGTALIEIYFLICSNSLYQQCLVAQENAVNTTENTVIKFENVPSPPPMYNSCENDMQSDNNAGMYPKINP